MEENNNNNNNNQNQQMDLESQYQKGLPFTVDFKRMVEKTIKNRFHNKNEYLNQLTKLGLLNAQSKIDIQNKKNNISIEFDTNAKLREEEFRTVIFDLYGGNSSEIEDKEGTKIQNLGLTIAAALASNPKEIIVEVNGTDNNSYRMVIDSELKPVITTLPNPIATSKVVIIKDPDAKIEKVSFNGNKFEKIIGRIDHKIHDFRYNMDSSSRSRILNSSQFSQVQVNLNGKQINRGLHLEDVLFEKEYTLSDGSVANLSFPSNLLSRDSLIQIPKVPEVYFVKDNILVSSDNLSEYISKTKGKLSSPNIIIKSDSFIQTMSSSGINKETTKRYQNELEEIIEEFSNDVFLKLEEKGNFDWAKKSRFSSERLEQSGLLTPKYYHSGVFSLPNGDTKQTSATKKFIETKIIKDTTGKEYTVQEFNDELAKSKTFVFTSEKSNPSKKVKNNLGITTPIFLVPKLKDRYGRDNPLISSLVSNQRGGHKAFKEVNLEELISDEKSRKRSELKEKTSKALEISGTGAKWTLGPTIIGGGTFVATPYVIAGLEIASQFFFEDNLVETALISGIVASGFAGAYTLPKVGRIGLNALDKASNKVKKTQKVQSIIEKRKEERDKKLDEKNLDSDKIFERLNNNEQRYVTGLYSLIQGCNINNEIISSLSSNEKILKHQPTKIVGFEKIRSRYGTQIDCFSERFSNQVEEFSNGNFHILTNELRRYVQLSNNLSNKDEEFSNGLNFDSQQRFLDQYILEETIKAKRYNLVNQYFQENSQFQETFNTLSQNERLNLIKVMLNDYREESPNEDWLFNNYQREIDVVTDRIISKTDFNQLMDLYHNPNLANLNYESELKYRFLNMTSQEKFEVSSQISIDGINNGIQNTFKNEVVRLAPEFFVSGSERTMYYQTSDRSESLNQKILSNSLGEQEMEYRIDDYIEFGRNEQLYRRSLRLIGDFIPQRQKQIGEILY